MNWALVAIFAVVALLLVGSGLVRRGGVYGYPFLAGATFLGFVLPQLPGLAADPFLPPGAFAMTMGFTIACAALCGVGWWAGRRPLAGLAFRIDEKQAVWAAAGLSLFGAFFFYQLTRLPEEVRSITQPSGLPVMYIFFGRALTYGFAVAVLCFAGRPSKLALAVIAFDAIFLADRVIVGGRRADIAEIGLCILLALWFRRDWVIPRVFALMGMLAVAVSLTSASDYRGLVHDQRAPSWSDVATINVLGNFEMLLAEGGPEMHNAMVRIYDVDRNQRFDFGLFHWDTLVFNFVPAQIVGPELKEALMSPLPDQRELGYEPVLVGSTETGMTDAFGSFWYFGALKFFLVAYCLARLYRTALAGSFMAQVIFALSLTPAMHVITHHTQWIVSAWVTMALILVPPLVICVQRSRRATRPARRAVGLARGEA